MDEMWVLAVGSPWDGMALKGLFASPQEAIEWAEMHATNIDWWIIKVYDVRDKDDERPSDPKGRPWHERQDAE
jgi:hypothetical protein